MTPTEIVKGFHERRVLVVGDVGLDRYIHGACTRLCPEAPVPVFTPSRQECRAGLAGNVATNLAALGAQVKLCSMIGDDQDGMDLQDLLDQAGVIEVEKYLGKTNRRTTLKTRYVSDWHLMLRMDEEDTEPFNEKMMKRFSATVEKEIRDWADIVIVQDYAKGLLNPALMAAIGHTAYIKSKDVVVDPSPRQNPTLYLGATYLKPNSREADLIVGKLGLRGEHDIVERLKLKGLLVTLGPSGMIAHSRGTITGIDATRKEVHDVCGAGDTVTAVLALGLVSGLSFDDSARLANTAAGVVVGKFGTATLTRDELLGALNG